MSPVAVDEQYDDYDARQRRQRRRGHGRRLLVLARYDRRARRFLLVVAVTCCVIISLAFVLLSTPSHVGFPRSTRGPPQIGIDRPPRRTSVGASKSEGTATGGDGGNFRDNFVEDGAGPWDQERRGIGGGVSGEGEDDCEESYGCPLRPYDVDDWPPFLGGGGEDSAGTATSGPRRTWCGATQRSNQHKHNQDRAVVVSPFLHGELKRKDGNKATHGGKGWRPFLIGIFDGHGDYGHLIAEHVLRDLPDRIASKLGRLLSDADGGGSNRPAGGGNEQDEEFEFDPDDVKRILIESFLECDASAPGPAALDGGSTASIVMGFDRKYIYTANVGDSLSFVGARTNDGAGAYIIHNTTRHKPHLAEEKARIESMGGRVHVPPPPKNPSLARAVAYNSVKREPVGLAMSRSLGDWEHGDAGVIAEPTVEVLEVDGLRRQVGGGGGGGGGGEASALFAVSVSDGVTDSRKAELVANKVAKYLFAGDGEEEGAEDGCLDVIEVATPKNKKWYRDDMTVVAVRIG